MIRRADGLIVPVQNAFWPALFTSPLVVKFVGQCVVLCLNNRSLQTQLFLIYPEEGFSDLPQLKTLLEQFPFDGKGRKYHDPNQLPIPLSELRNIAGLEIDSIKFQGRTVYLITPVWLPENEEVKLADSIFTSVYFQVNKFDEGQILTCSENHLLLHLETPGEQNYKAIALIRHNAIVNLAPGVEIVSTSDGDVRINDSNVARRLEE